MAAEAQQHEQAIESAPAKDKTFSPDSYQSECQKAQQTSEADLCQQWRMANAAEKQLEVITAQYRLQIWEIILLVGTFAGSLSALVITIRTNRRQLRAYISVEPGQLVTFADKSGVRLEFQPIVRNVGQTPAYDLHYSSRAGVFEFPLPDNFKFDCAVHPLHSKATLGKDQFRVAYIGVEKTYTPDEFTVISTHPGPLGNPKAYAFGVVSYRDAFGKIRRTHFCFVAVWGTDNKPILLTTQQHNHAD